MRTCDGIRPITLFAALLFAATLLNATAHPADAAEPFEKVPTATYTALVYPTGARNLAMGGTGAADMTSYATGYFNAASVAWSDGVQLTTGYQVWFLDFNAFDARLSGGRELGEKGDGNWRLAGSLGYTELSRSFTPPPVPFLPPGTGQPFGASDDNFFSATGAVAWENSTLSIGAGAAAKYLRESISDETATTWAFDLGLVLAATARTSSNYTFRGRVGTSVNNLSSGLSYASSSFDLIGEYRAGLGGDFRMPPIAVFNRDVPLLGLSMDYDRNYSRNISSDPSGWAYGLELSAIDMVQFRYGRGKNINFASRGKSTTAGVGLGWSFGMWSAQLDYAFVSTTPETIFTNAWDESGFGIAVRAKF